LPTPHSSARFREVEGAAPVYMVISLSSISHQLFLSRIKQPSPPWPILKKAVEIRAIKKYLIACDRSEAEILYAAKKYCPEAVSEIDAVFKLAS
jgi:hypothetical protein